MRKFKLEHDGALKFKVMQGKESVGSVKISVGIIELKQTVELWPMLNPHLNKTVWSVRMETEQINDAQTELTIEESILISVTTGNKDTVIKCCVEGIYFSEGLTEEGPNEIQIDMFYRQIYQP